VRAISSVTERLRASHLMPRRTTGAHRRHGVDLTEGPVGAHLVNLGVFLALGVFANLGTNLADIYFVAHLNAQALAALSFTFPLVLITSAIALGFGNGVIAIVARAVGEGDHDTIRILGTDSILLAVLVVGAMAIIGLLTIYGSWREL
jgi:Na+-driven multidrug efflux pump